MMKPILIVVMSFTSLSVWSQVTVGRPWKVQLGASTNTYFTESFAYNLRYVSPRFNWSDDDMIEDEVKQATQFKRARIMFELIYTPPHKVLCAGANIQYRFYKYKKLSLEIVGGMKFFFVPGPDFVKVRPLKGGKGNAWYINFGLLAQLDLGILSPFADFGGDGILTVGSEFNLRGIYRNPKKRYKLRAKSVDK